MVMGRRKFCATLVASALLLAGCGGADPVSGAATTPQDAAPAAEFTTVPGDGAVDVVVNVPVEVTVTDGTIDEVTLTNDRGEQVRGQLAEDRTSWKSAEPLGFGRSYTYAGTASGGDGAEVRLTGTFSTLPEGAQNRATLYPGDDQTVGVAVPIIVKFDAPVTDRASAQKALSVTSSAGDPGGSWAWLSDQEIHYRPEKYWPANTRVHVEAKLYGVPYGDGVYGKADVTSDFTIGRNQVVKIDNPTHQLVVQRDGQTVATYPASFGKDDDSELTTPNGTFVVMSKHDTWSFDNPRYGYTNVVKKWAVRFSNHGEFIHENNDNAANIGKNNTSHGCANLLEADAKAYFDSALIGDPVEVVNSITTLEPVNDWYDWQLTWDQWKAKSAL
ncbi:L,D-transpeptidase [Umezawaea beigongshangensis]|uniref:L,D-transpeptidase n=1 Tax=Umezawaea beigongshangensis TaxID=2780383 RepID=UPI003F684C9A